MTVLTLTRLWINRLDTGEGVSAATDPSRSQSYSMDLDVRTYASGRRRAISVEGEKGEFSFQLIAIDLATVAKLRVWAGANVQVRDHRGQRWFGVFAGLSVGEYKAPLLYSATITLETTTTTEGV